MNRIINRMVDFPYYLIFYFLSMVLTLPCSAPGAGNSACNCRNNTRVKWAGEDASAMWTSNCVCERVCRCELHGECNACGACIERTTEDSREGEGVIYLI